MSEKNASPNKKKAGIRFLTLLMVIVILLTLIINVFCVYNIFGKSPKNLLMAEGLTAEQNDLKEKREELKKHQAQLKNTGAVSCHIGGVDGTLNYTIVDRGDVLDVLEKIAGQLGISDPREEYSIVDEVSTEYYDVYTAQQYFNGTEIYGKRLKVTVDKSGNLVSVDGDHADLSGADLVSNYSQYDAYDNLLKYIKKEYQMSEDEVSIDYLGFKIIYLNDTPMYAYLYDVTFVTDDGFYSRKIAIGAENGDVVSNMDNLMYSGTKEVKLKGQLGDQNLDIYENSDEDYEMRDDNRKIRVKRASETTVSDENWETVFKDVVWNPKKKSPSDIEVDALANVEHIYEQYKKVFKREGIISNTELPIYTNISVYYDHNIMDNAAMCGDSFILVGTSSDVSLSAYFDVMAHEFTHGVVYHDSDLNSFTAPEGTDGQKFPQKGINEGLADTMAEILEYYQYGSNDWKITEEGMRDITDPTNSKEGDDDKTRDQLHITDARDYEFGRLNCHYSSTILSHPAYLMSIGVDDDEKALSMEQLAQLYYNVIPRLTSYLDFDRFRLVLEKEALNMNKNYHSGASAPKLSDEQLECVIDALDTSYTKRAYSPGYDYYETLSLTPGAELTVYDCFNKKYKDYSIKIVRASDEGTVYEADATDSTFKLDSKVVPGIYIICLTDKNKNVECKIPVYVNDNKYSEEEFKYKSTADILTQFNTAERSVALVLDNSGSMAGSPMSETKNAAVKFVNYVFEENPNILISVIPYNTNATVAVTTSNNKEEILAAIRSLSSGGGTNMHSGINVAYDILSKSDSDKRLMIVMSDGYPENGPKGSDGKFESAILELADTVKSNDIIVYSLGFFHKMDGDQLKNAKALMTGIASDGYDYNVVSSKDLAYAFEDMAEYVTGKYSVLVRIACPVDVTVSCSGEVLTSEKNSRNTRASFGSLSFEGEDDEIKVLRLNNDANYEICINGTGKGTMDYSISFADENGEYSDVRTFKRVPINKDTIIATNTRSAGKTSLKIDSDGDGKFDKTYSASKNRKGKEVNSNVWLYVLIFSGVVLIGLIVWEVLLIRKRIKKNKFCLKCGNSVSKETKFCRICGEPKKRVPILLPEKKEREKQPGGIIAAKLIVMGVCMMITVGVLALYRSAATNVFNQIRNQELLSASTLYENSVEDKWLSQKYLSIATKNYLKKVDKKFKSGTFSEGAVNEIYRSVAEMDMGTASELAEEYLANNGIELGSDKKPYDEDDEEDTTSETTSGKTKTTSGKNKI